MFRLLVASLALLVPALATAAPAACPPGQSKTADTAGHCCFAGQAWAGGRCRGIPTGCPAGTELSGESCLAQPPKKPFRQAWGAGRWSFSSVQGSSDLPVLVFDREEALVYLRPDGALGWTDGKVAYVARGDCGISTERAEKKPFLVAHYTYFEPDGSWLLPGGYRGRRTERSQIELTLAGGATALFEPYSREVRISCADGLQRFLGAADVSPTPVSDAFGIWTIYRPAFTRMTYIWRGGGATALELDGTSGAVRARVDGAEFRVEGLKKGLRSAFVLHPWPLPPDLPNVSVRSAGFETAIGNLHIARMPGIVDVLLPPNQSIQLLKDSPTLEISDRDFSDRRLTLSKD